MATEFIFTHPIIKTIATGLTGFTIGVVSVAGLHSFTGGTLLTNTQTEVSTYVDNVQSNINGLSSYLQSNNTANAEVIEKYQQALDKANENLAELKKHITTSDNSLETELVALQERYDKLQASVDQQVQAKVDEVIAEANIQIDAANTASETTYNNVHASLEGGNITQTVTNIKDANPALAVKDEDLQVESIADIVGLRLYSFEIVTASIYQKYYKSNGAEASSYASSIYKVEFNDGNVFYVATFLDEEIKGLSTDGEKFYIYEEKSELNTEFNTTYKALFEEQWQQYLANKQ